MKRGIPVIPRSLKFERIQENFLSVNFIDRITSEHLQQLWQLDASIPMIELSYAAFSQNQQL